MDLANEPVGQLALNYPGATRVFDQHGIDYCCGGGMPLSTACRRVGRPLADVLAALERAQQQDEDSLELPDDLAKRSLAELVDFICERFHEHEAAELARLETLGAKVLRVHGERHPHLGKVVGTFRTLRAELTAHMMKEERVLFPYLVELDQRRVQGGQWRPPPFASARNPIGVMLREHDRAGELLGVLRAAANDYAPPSDACGSYRALYAGLAALEHDLHLHVLAENEILFPGAIAAESALRDGV